MIKKKELFNMQVDDALLQVQAGDVPVIHQSTSGEEHEEIAVMSSQAIAYDKIMTFSAFRKMSTIAMKKALKDNVIKIKWHELYVRSVE